MNRDSLTIAVKDDDIDIFYKYYEQVTALREKGVKVLISIEDWIDPPPYRQVPALNDSIARIDFVNSVVEFLEKHNFDGLNVDLEVKPINKHIVNGKVIFLLLFFSFFHSIKHAVKIPVK